MSILYKIDRPLGAPDTADNKLEMSRVVHRSVARNTGALVGVVGSAPCWADTTPPDPSFSLVLS